MELEPRSLGVPLHPRSRFPQWLVLGVLLAAGAAWWVDAPFGLAFLAACVTVLPVLCIGVFAKRSSVPGRWRAARGGAWTVAAVVLYAALSKSMLLPALLRWWAPA